MGFVFATIKLFLCCHENLLVPTHTQSQREIEIQLVCFVENLAQTSVFSNPLILKNKKHKGTIYDKLYTRSNERSEQPGPSMQSLFPFKISATLFAFRENYKLCCIL